MPIVVDISWGTGGGAGGGGGLVCSITQINNYCSVDSDDDFR